MTDQPLSKERAGAILHMAEIRAEDWDASATPQIAVAVQRVLFDGGGELIGAFNKALLKEGYLIGEAFLRTPDGTCWNHFQISKSDFPQWASLKAEMPTRYKADYARRGRLTPDVVKDFEIKTFDSEKDLFDFYREAAPPCFLRDQPSDAPMAAFLDPLIRAARVHGKTEFPACNPEDVRRAIAEGDARYNDFQRRACDWMIATRNQMGREKLLPRDIEGLDRAASDLDDPFPALNQIWNQLAQAQTPEQALRAVTGRLLKVKDELAALDQIRHGFADFDAVHHEEHLLRYGLADAEPTQENADYAPTP